MTMDRRFPMLKRLEECRSLFNGDGYRYVQEVCRRTGTTGIVNTQGTGRVIFRYGQNISGPLGVSITQVRGWTGGDCDAAVEYIQRGKIPAEEKDRIAAADKQAERADREQFEGRVLENAEPHARDYVAFNDRKRRGMVKTTVA